MEEKKRVVSRLCAVAILVSLLSGCIPVNSLPTPTLTALPDPTPTPTRIQTPEILATLPPANGLKIFLIALDDNGQSGKLIGCNDSLIPVERPILASHDPEKSALEDLLAQKEQFYGESGLYNALYQSDLMVESVQVDDNGLAIVHLAGAYHLGGVCDGPRFEAQIKATVLQFTHVQEVAVFINGLPLEEILSGRGGSSPLGDVYTHAAIFLIILEDNGVAGKAIGCGDSVVPEPIEFAVTTDLAVAITASLQSLLGLGDEYIGTIGRYDALAWSRLQVDSVSVHNGEAVIHLTGTLELVGECDAPRAAAQLEETALQFSGVEQVSIFLNGQPLEEALSLVGE